MRSSYYNLIPKPSPTWSTATNLGTITGGTAVSIPLVATTPIGETMAYSLASGSFPTGLNFGSSGIAGVPGSPGATGQTYSFWLKATGAQTAAFSEKQFSLTVNKDVNTVGLWHCDGDYSDSSGNGINLVATNPGGAAQVQTTTFKYGTGALTFSTSQSNATQDIRIPASSSLLMGGDFTLELWHRMTGNSGTPIIFCTATGNVGSNTSTDAALGISVYYQTARWNIKFQNSIAISGTKNPFDSSWHHFAIVRSGTGTNNVKFYYDGIQDAQATVTGNIDLGQTYGMKLGQWTGTNATNNYQGQIDDIRISNVARYTTNFTPPAAALPNP